jgi:hypothetical protein
MVSHAKKKLVLSRPSEGELVLPVLSGYHDLTAGGYIRNPALDKAQRS